MRLPVLLTTAAAAGMMFSVANAATITASSQTLPSDHFVAPNFSVGTVVPAKGSVSGEYASPFGDSTSEYGAVQNGYAEYDFTHLFSSLSLIWGTPDSYNTLQFLLGGVVVDSIGGSSVGSQTNNYFVTVKSDAAFDAVRLVSTSPAFEYSNVSAVPLPASAPMFGAALLGLAGLGYAASRKKAAAAA